jgi:hypothetical protein
MTGMSHLADLGKMAQEENESGPSHLADLGKIVQEDSESGPGMAFIEEGG